MEEKTLKELKEELVQLGMPEEDTENFRTKAAAQATIDVLRSSSVEEVEEEPKVKTIEERPNPSEEKEVNKAWKSKAERMKNKLLKQEFVSLLVPLEPQERVGEVAWVDPETEETIPFDRWFKLPISEKMKTYQKHISGDIIIPQLNGFKYMIPKGTYSRVPMQIFEVVNEANMEQIKATQYKNLDRLDPKTGRPFKESF
jgi:hypothetical protein